jgi:hypothetical protein
MPEHEKAQPEAVSEPLANYLDMTAPRTDVPKDRLRRRTEQKRATPPQFDNRDLCLEEGNDFA